MTKAEKIFKETYFQSRHHIRIWGEERNPDGTMIGFTGLITEEPTCRRTWNAVQKLIDRERKKEAYAESLGINPEIRTLCRAALEMVQTTLNNEIKKAERFEKWLAEN